MIIKLCSLPRAGSHWIGHCIEQTWPEVRVWHNIGAWKHGIPKLVEGADAYLFCSRRHNEWLDSMYRYIHYHTNATKAFVTSPAQTWAEHEDVLTMYYEGWQERATHFYAKKRYLWDYNPDPNDLAIRLHWIAHVFELPIPDKFNIELRYMTKYTDSDMLRVEPFTYEHMVDVYRRHSMLTRPKQHDENLAHDPDPDPSSSSGHPEILRH